MEKSLSKNRPTLCESVLVNRLQFDHIFTDAAADKGDEIAKSLATLKDDIAPAADKTFVMMKNKQVWFDRNNAALYPKFEAGVLPTLSTYCYCNYYSGLDFEGFHFVAITGNEFKKSFLRDKGNPYLDGNNFKSFPSGLSYYHGVLVDDSSNSMCYFSDNTNNAHYYDGWKMTTITRCES